MSPGFWIRTVLMSLQGVHVPVRDLDLHLVADAGLGVGPVVGDHETAGGCCLHDRVATSRAVTPIRPAISRSMSMLIVG